MESTSEKASIKRKMGDENESEETEISPEVFDMKEMEKSLVQEEKKDHTTIEPYNFELYNDYPQSQKNKKKGKGKKNKKIYKNKKNNKKSKNEKEQTQTDKNPNPQIKSQIDHRECPSVILAQYIVDIQSGKIIIGYERDRNNQVYPVSIEIPEEAKNNKKHSFWRDCLVKRWNGDEIELLKKRQPILRDLDPYDLYWYLHKSHLAFYNQSDLQTFCITPNYEFHVEDSSKTQVLLDIGSISRKMHVNNKNELVFSKSSKNTSENNNRKTKLERLKIIQQNNKLSVIPIGVNEDFMAVLTMAEPKLTDQDVVSQLLQKQESSSVQQMKLMRLPKLINYIPTNEILISEDKNEAMDYMIDRWKKFSVPFTTIISTNMVGSIITILSVEFSSKEEEKIDKIKNKFVNASEPCTQEDLPDYTYKLEKINLYEPNSVQKIELPFVPNAPIMFHVFNHTYGIVTVDLDSAKNEARKKEDESKYSVVYENKNREIRNKNINNNNNDSSTTDKNDDGIEAKQPLKNTEKEEEEENQFQLKVPPYQQVFVFVNNQWCLLYNSIQITCINLKSTILLTGCFDEQGYPVIHYYDLYHALSYWNYKPWMATRHEDLPFLHPIKCIQQNPSRFLFSSDTRFGTYDLSFYGRYTCSVDAEQDMNASNKKLFSWVKEADKYQSTDENMDENESDGIDAEPYIIHADEENNKITVDVMNYPHHQENVSSSSYLNINRTTYCENLFFNHGFNIMMERVIFYSPNFGKLLIGDVYNHTFCLHSEEFQPPPSIDYMKDDSHFNYSHLVQNSSRIITLLSDGKIKFSLCEKLEEFLKKTLIIN